MCSGLKDFQLLCKYSQKHHTNLQKKHTEVASNMQLQEKESCERQKQEERRAECNKTSEHLISILAMNFFIGIASEEKKILNKNAVQEKPPHSSHPQPKQSFVKATPMLAGLGFRAKLGSPFSCSRQSWCGTPHWWKPTISTGLGRGSRTNSRKRAVEGRTHGNHMQLRKSSGCKWFRD